jgi:hypothetical protein
MGELLNLVGLSTGVVLYAMLLAMVVRGSRTPGGPSRFDWLLLATSDCYRRWSCIPCSGANERRSRARLGDRSSPRRTP